MRRRQKLLKIFYFFSPVIFAVVFLAPISYARITPLAFKGTSQYFNEGKEYYAPVLGMVALESGLIYNLRFYGNFESAYKGDNPRVRDYINDSSTDPLWKLAKTLFPSSGGDLTTQTNSEHNFGKHVISPRTVALLLEFSYQLRIPKVYQQSYIEGIQQGKKPVKSSQTSQAWRNEIFNSLLITANTEKNNLKNAIKNLLEMIAQSIDQELKPSSFYPQYTTEQVILAFFCEKFDTQTDIIELLGALAELNKDRSLIRDNQQQGIQALAQKIRSARIAKVYLKYQQEEKEKREAGNWLENIESRDQQERQQLLLESSLIPIRRLSADDEAFIKRLIETPATDLTELSLAKMAAFIFVENLSTANDLEKITSNIPLDLDELYAVANRDIFRRNMPYKSKEKPISNGTTQAYDRKNNRLVNHLTFSDCIDIIPRHILNLMVYDPINNKFNLEPLKASLEEKRNQVLWRYFQELNSFYQQQPPIGANAGGENIRSLWNRVVGDLNALDDGNPLKILYVRKHPTGFEYELDTGFINTINVFRKLFGLKLPEGSKLAALNPYAANFQEKKDWLISYFQALFTLLNPDRITIVTDSGLYEGRQQAHSEIFGNLDVVVNDKSRTPLFSFTIYQDASHGYLANLKDLLTINKLEDKPTSFEHNKVNTSLNSISLLLPTEDQQATELLYQVYPGPLQDNESRINSLQILKTLTPEQNKILHIQSMVGHALEALSWDDQATISYVSPTLIGLLEHFGKTLAAHVKGFNTHSLNSEKLQEILPRFLFLESLNLSGNSGLRFLSLPPLVNLKRLDLSISSVSKLAGLENLIALQELNLSKTKELHGLLMPALPNLRSLNLSNSSISKLEGLESLTALQELNLSNAENIHDLILPSLEQLARLNLSHISLSKLDGMENLQALQELDLSKTVNLQELFLPPLANMISLNLSGSGVSKLEGLENVPSLQVLNLSWTENLQELFLPPLVNVINLSLSNSSVSKLSGLENLIALQRLNLSKMDNLKEVILPPLANLNDLSLSESCISKLHLVSMPVLQEINLSWTENLQELFLPPLANLHNLDLNGSGLLKLEGLENVPSLQVLTLSWTKNLQRLLLPPLVNLMSLNLSGSSISKLEGLRNLVALQELKASQTHNLHDLILPSWAHLRMLDLSKSSISKLEGLGNLTALADLNLSETSKLQMLSLPSLVYLRNLNLSGSALITLEGLENLPALQVLNLSKTKKLNKLLLPTMAFLRQLNLAESLVSQIHLESLPNLTLLDLSRMHKFEELSIGAEIMDLSYTVHTKRGQEVLEKLREAR